MFRCNAACCDNTSLSIDDLQRCLENCSRPALNADNYIKQEMQDLESRFKRCAMACADEVRDRASGSGSNDQQKHRAELEQCVNKCGDEMTKLLPSFTKRMGDWFKKGSFNN